MLDGWFRKQATKFTKKALRNIFSIIFQSLQILPDFTSHSLQKKKKKKSDIRIKENKA